MFLCDHCGKDFQQQKAYYNHNLSIHQKAVCTVCKKSFSPSNIAAHMKTHNDEGHKSQSSDKKLQKLLASHA